MKSGDTKNTIVTVDHNNIPEGWKKVKLGKVSDLSKISWKVGGENFPYIGLEYIIKIVVILWEDKYNKLRKLLKKISKKGMIFLSMDINLYNIKIIFILFLV